MISIWKPTFWGAMNLCLPVVQPSMRNISSNSSTRLRQHVQPFDESWNSGWPKWNTHSSARDDASLYVALQPRCRHFVPTAMTVSGASGSSVNFGSCSCSSLVDVSSIAAFLVEVEVEFEDDCCCCCCSFAFFAAELNAWPYCSIPLADTVGAPICSCFIYI